MGLEGVRLILCVQDDDGSRAGGETELFALRKKLSAVKPPRLLANPHALHEARAPVLDKAVAREKDCG